LGLHSTSKAKAGRPNFGQAFAIASALRAAQHAQSSALRCTCPLRTSVPGPKHRKTCPLHRTHAVDPERSRAAKLGWKRRKRKQRTREAAKIVKAEIERRKMRLEELYEDLEEEWHELADLFDIEDRELYSFLMDSPTVSDAA
jgi:hypothetical protein